MNSDKNNNENNHSLTIRVRLFLLFILTVVLLGAISLYSVSIYKNTLVVGNQVQNSARVNVDFALQVQVYFEKQISAWKNVLLRGHEQDSYHKNIQKFYESERKTKKELINLSDRITTSSKLKNLTTQIIDSHYEAGKVLRNGIRLFNDSNENAHILADIFGQEAISKTAGLMDSYIEIAKNERDSSLAQIDRDLKKKETGVLISVAVILTGLVVIIFWVVDKNIGQPAQNALRLEKELRHHKEELEQTVAERTAELKASNEELESYSYSIAHDLRAPLRTITSFSQIILTDAADKLTEDDVNHLRRVIGAGNHMSQLILDILALSRVTRNEIVRDRLNLSDIASNIINQLRLPDESRQVEVVIEDNLIARGDPKLVYVLLDNLLANAWKYSSRKDRAKIEFGSEVVDGIPAFSVKDNGVGFDMDYAEKIFKPFHRLHSRDEFEGTGVGLATVDRIVKRHGGNIWVDAKKGEGAQFYFTLDPIEVAPDSEEIIYREAV